MKFSNYKKAHIEEDRRVRAVIVFKGSNGQIELPLCDSKAENRKERKHSIRMARRALALIKKDIRKYREHRRISSVQFADKLMSFQTRADFHRYLEMVSPTISEIVSYYPSYPQNLN